MALKHEKKQHLSKGGEIPTASLGDIVFLLLIFFLVTTSMNTEKGLGLVLPPPGDEVKLNKENILSVFINSEGQILVGVEVISPEQLTGKVKERIRENPLLIVSVITDVNASYKSMISALDRVKVAFSELKKDEKFIAKIESDPKFKSEFPHGFAERISLATPAF
jgi:biopolymer transport protein ExbD